MDNCKNLTDFFLYTASLSPPHTLSLFLSLSFALAAAIQLSAKNSSVFLISVLCAASVGLHSNYDSVPTTPSPCF